MRVPMAMAYLCDIPVTVWDFAVMGSIPVAFVQFTESGEPEMIPASALSFFQTASREVN